MTIHACTRRISAPGCPGLPAALWLAASAPTSMTASAVARIRFRDPAFTRDLTLPAYGQVGKK